MQGEKTMRPWTARKYLNVSRFARKADVDLKKALEGGDQERAAKSARRAMLPENAANRFALSSVTTYSDRD
jgi:hypothetical protein